MNNQTMTTIRDAIKCVDDIMEMAAFDKKRHDDYVRRILDIELILRLLYDIRDRSESGESVGTTLYIRTAQMTNDSAVPLPMRLDGYEHVPTNAKMLLDQLIKAYEEVQATEERECLSMMEHWKTVCEEAKVGRWGES